MHILDNFLVISLKNYLYNIKLNHYGFSKIM